MSTQPEEDTPRRPVAAGGTTDGGKPMPLIPPADDTTDGGKPMPLDEPTS